jgi:hypothetical protein
VICNAELSPLYAVVIIADSLLASSLALVGLLSIYVNTFVMPASTFSIVACHDSSVPDAGLIALVVFVVSPLAATGELASTNVTVKELFGSRFTIA